MFPFAYNTKPIQRQLIDGTDRAYERVHYVYSYKNGPTLSCLVRLKRTKSVSRQGTINQPNKVYKQNQIDLLCRDVDSTHFQLLYKVFDQAKRVLT